MGSLSIASHVYPVQSHGFVIGFLLAMYGGIGAAMYSQVVAIFTRSSVDFSYFFLLSIALIGSCVTFGAVLTFVSLLLWSATDVKDDSNFKPTWRQVISRKMEYLRKKVFYKKKMAASLNAVVAGLMSPRNLDDDDDEDITDEDYLSIDTSLEASPAVTVNTPYTEKHTLLLNNRIENMDETPIAGIFIQDTAETPPPHEQPHIGTIPGTEEKLNPNSLRRIQQTNPISPSAKQPDFSLLRAITSFEFWLIAACYYITASTGIFVVWNIGAIVISLGGHNGEQSNHVTVIALCSCAARLIFGFLSDRLAVRFSRAFFVLIAVVMSGTAQFYLLFANSSIMLFPGVILSALAYGGVNCSMPVIVRQSFGQRRFATIMSSIMIGYQLCGGVVISSIIPALLYEREIVVESSNYCHGMRCYRNVYILNMCLCIFGGVLAFILCLRRKNKEQWL
eukprot:CAMPEP_0117443114 /NCGR_PEP_ID=MMETSP0759-20121206/4522_1 /TAXON_ID=63605 /ORGANISM="Percolomonas cosmopolitus, Strain WS" /LENGTH=449 /DNA_ID=CAMNT_0005235067 /DNA_START=1368 /DNA_END=2717 /DNA_ORIENTATION=-